MCIQWTQDKYSVITRQSNPPISQFNSPCNEFTSVWSMFVYNSVALLMSVTDLNSFSMADVSYCIRFVTDLNSFSMADVSYCIRFVTDLNSSMADVSNCIRCVTDLNCFSMADVCESLTFYEDTRIPVLSNGCWY